MSEAKLLDSEGLEEAYYRLYRDFFDRAEKKRRWSIRDDIPWTEVNSKVPAEVADVVESFCAVEMFLPDYIAKALPVCKVSLGRAWFHANWGYEESKHSLAMGDWLLRSGHRTEEQLTDLEGQVLTKDWNLPHDSPIGMVVYGMIQELATWLNYKNLRQHAVDHGDGALAKILQLVCVDERAHHDFYMRITQMYLQRDRSSTLEVLRRVLHSFAMPAIYMLADSRQRVQAIRDLEVFNEEIFYRDVVMPLLEKLGIEWSDIRQRKPGRKTLSTTGMNLVPPS